MEDLYKCPECDWIGTEDQMESTYEESWDGEEEYIYGSMYVCPICYYDLGEGFFHVNKDYLITKD